MSRTPKTARLSECAQTCIEMLRDLDGYQDDSVSMIVETALSRLLESELELADALRVQDELREARAAMPRAIARILEAL